MPGDDMIFETIWAVDAETGALQADEKKPEGGVEAAAKDADETSTSTFEKPENAKDEGKQDDFEALKARAVTFLCDILGIDRGIHAEGLEPWD